MTKLLSVALLIAPIALCGAEGDDQVWSPARARAYLDERAGWWIAWKSAARDQETFCISCHTALPYVLARPALRTSAGEQAPSPNEQKILDNVVKRVRLWNEVQPIYSDEKNGPPKTAEARGTESVIYALVLSKYDAPKGKLSADTKLAFDNRWSLQLKSGAWNWLNFQNEPWEADDSQFWGTALAAIAAGNAPRDYKLSPSVAAGIQALSSYLQHGQEDQSLLNRCFLLWASAELPNLLTRAEREAIIRAITEKQQPNGGWSTVSLLPAGWKRRDSTALTNGSDGYATGLITFVLQKVGLPRTDPRVKQGLTWLIANQNVKTGSWEAVSPNKQRDPASDAGRFMTDAATAYAVMALDAVSQ